jgi:hypothetical protein
MGEERTVSEGLEHEEQETGAPIEQVACDLCGMMLHSEEDLREHRKHCKDEMENDQEHQPSDEFTCEFCESKFSLQEELRNHQNHCSVRQRADSR